MPTVEQILNSELASPTLSYRPTRIKPLGTNMTFKRSTDVQTFTSGRKYETRAAGEPRIWGPDEALFTEGQFTERISNPADFSAGDWTDELNLAHTYAAGTAFGTTFTEFRETTADGRHQISNGSYATNNRKVHIKALIRPQGRDYFRISPSVRDSNANNTGNVEVSYRLSDGDIYIVSEQNGTLREARVVERYNGWYEIRYGIKMASGHYIFNTNFQLATGHGMRIYPGDTSKGFDIAVANVSEGQSANTSFAFSTKTVNRDVAEFYIPSERWNNDEGTWFLEVTPDFDYAENFPRILNIRQGEIYLYPTDINTIDLNRIEVNLFDSQNNKSVDVLTPKGEPFAPRLKIMASIEKDGRWAIACNGRDRVDQGSNAHDNKWLTRPTSSNTAEIGRAGKHSPFTLHDLRYIPRWVPKQKRKIFTAK